MNSVNSIGQNMATDGQNIKTTASRRNSSTSSLSQRSASEEILIARSGSEVAQNIEKTEADIKADARELQKLSDLVMGPKLRFNVNNELGSVIIKIVDPSTEQVIKEIPSVDMQKLKIRIRKAIGVLFDEMI